MFKGPKLVVTKSQYTVQELGLEKGKLSLESWVCCRSSNCQSVKDLSPRHVTAWSKQSQNCHWASQKKIQMKCLLKEVSWKAGVEGDREKASGWLNLDLTSSPVDNCAFSIFVNLQLLIYMDYLHSLTSTFPYVQCMKTFQVRALYILLCCSLEAFGLGPLLSFLLLCRLRAARGSTRGPGDEQKFTQIPSLM